MQVSLLPAKLQMKALTYSQCLIDTHLQFKATHNLVQFVVSVRVPARHTRVVK